MPSDKRLTILHILAPDVVGGLERVVHALALGHHRAGHHVTVAAVVDANSEDHSFVEPLSAAGVNVIVIGLHRRAYLAERRRIREICRTLQPDVVHTHGYRPDILDAGVARRLGIPTVTTVHGSSRLGGVTHLYEWLQTFTFSRFDAVVAVSREIVHSLHARAVAKTKIFLIPNAWTGNPPSLDRDAARRALGLPVDQFVVGWVGRLIPAKGCDVFLDAIAQLTDVPWVASIIGDGHERPALEAQVKRYGLDGRVHFHGSMMDAANFFSAFDLYVLSSRTEGTPIVLFEAMGAGIPVVATAVGGIPDVITEQAGILVAPEDPPTLASGIRDVYLKPQKARLRTRYGIERLAQSYALEPWLQHYAEIYTTVRRC